MACSSAASTALQDSNHAQGDCHCIVPSCYPSWVQQDPEICFLTLSLPFHIVSYLQENTTLPCATVFKPRAGSSALGFPSLPRNVLAFAHLQPHSAVQPWVSTAHTPSPPNHCPRFGVPGPTLHTAPDAWVCLLLPAPAHCCLTLTEGLGSQRSSPCLAPCSGVPRDASPTGYQLPALAGTTLLLSPAPLPLPPFLPHATEPLKPTAGRLSPSPWALRAPRSRERARSCRPAAAAPRVHCDVEGCGQQGAAPALPRQTMSLWVLCCCAGGSPAQPPVYNPQQRPPRGLSALQ